MAHFWAAGPLPMTTRSKCSLALRSWRRSLKVGALEPLLKWRGRGLETSLRRVLDEREASIADLEGLEM
jgi:hypothetical protein